MYIPLFKTYNIKIKKKTNNNADTKKKKTQAQT